MEQEEIQNNIRQFVQSVREGDVSDEGVGDLAKSEDILAKIVDAKIQSRYNAARQKLEDGESEESSD